MKKQRAVEILILIFVFLVLTSALLVFRHYKYEKPNTYNIVFKDIDSIVKGSPVRFMGINVGHVVKLRRKDKYIICKIRVTKKGVKIPDNTRAKVAFNGLGGSKSIELLPPLTDEDDVMGILAVETLRINDLAGVVKDLKDMCIVINNFVQELDTDAIMDSFKEFTNPEIIDRVDSDMDKILKKQSELDSGIKKATKKEASFINLLDLFEKRFRK